MIDGEMDNGFDGNTRILKGSNLPTGTILATFPKIVEPGEKQKLGHIVVLLKVKPDYIWVIDQNESYRGIVAVHKIFFKSAFSTKEDIKNAFQYYSITRK